MNLKMKVFLAVSSLLLPAFAPPAFSAEFALVRDGKAASAIVVKKDAPPPAAFGAKELSAFLGKISSGEAPKVGASADPALYNVFVGTIADGELVKASGIDASKLKPDGFALSARKDGLYIVGADGRGALYGCYEILKKYGGIRWLVPGDDGEYFSVKKTISVPEQKTVRNPYLKIRLTVAAEDAAYCWLARNNMHAFGHSFHFVNPKTGKRTAKADFLEERAVEGNATAGNSHILTNLLGGWDHKNLKKNIEELYQLHPEYFPLVKGKRIQITGALSPNPCVSNPELLDHMAENLYARIKGKYGAQTYVTIGNNDTTVWCECGKCRAIDAPGLKNTKGARADRYWHMVNEIAKRIWKKDPSIRLGGWAYQDFWYPPANVKIDPRLRVMISFNNQCWRHSITDPKCNVNAELVRIMTAWGKTGLPLIVNRDEIACGGSLGSNYLPSERVLYENFKSYPALGYSGSSLCVPSPFPAFLSWAKNSEPFFGKNYRWLAMWQTCYLSAQFMWDINQDFDKLYEEANSLYYGKAWEGGFREFKKLQTKASGETPGCIGWGQGSPLGRSLDQAGVQEKLVALLDQAVEAAKTDPDPRALAHILRDKEIFEITWLKARENYLKNFKELNVYKHTAPIKIDGVLDEPDWKNADTLSNFKPGGHTPKNAKVEQSFVRVCYDPDYLYIGVEMMEPFPEKIVAGDAASVARGDGGGWSELGNHVELFYNYPDMAEKYYHLAINSKGAHIDAIQQSTTTRDTTFRTKAEYAVKVLKDRWILEIRIPCPEIGMNCFDGATWKLNVARGRKLEGREAESSSVCNGSFHGATNFINIKFTPARSRGIYNVDVSSWKNGSFDKAVSNAKISKYYRWKNWKFEEGNDLVPQFWNSIKGVGSYKKHEGSDSNYYIELEKGHIGQYYISPDPGKIRITFRAKGKGTAGLWTCSYENNPAGVSGYKQLKETSKNNPFKLTPEWKNYSFDAVKPGKKTERVIIRFTAGKESVLCLDDVIVSPTGK